MPATQASSTKRPGQTHAGLPGARPGRSFTVTGPLSISASAKSPPPWIVEREQHPMVFMNHAHRSSL